MAPEPVTRAPYRREPYVRATLDDGRVVDGKATAWTDSKVLVTWYDDTTTSEIVVGVHIHTHSTWVPAEQVQRIRRSESSWQNVYDNWQHYAEQHEC